MLPGCGAIASPTAGPPPARLVALTPAECRAVLQDDAPVTSLQHAIARSLDYVERLPDKTTAVFGLPVTAGDVRAVLETAAELAGGPGWPATLCDRVHLYRIDVPTAMLVTGYYQPELPASRNRTERFRYPLYRIPDDLVDVDLGEFCPACAGRKTQARVHDGRLVPYYSRAEIEAGALAGRDDEVAWLDDPVEAFFLHIQGSARLRFDDGVHMEISYGGSNGRPYTSIGRVLIEQGKMAREAVSLTALKDYLRSHPGEQAALMAVNQRYIFFRTVVVGPVGSLGVPLTAGRSVAADASVYPPGALVFVRIGRHQHPAPIGDPLAFQRFAVIQDAGTAITGPGRLDVYWGSGFAGEALAGDMRHPGEMYLALPQ